MPKKSREAEIIEVEPEPEPEPEIKISKRTGKPVRPLTEAQKANLAKGREKAIATRKALIEGIDLEKRAENIKRAKEEVHRAKIDAQKKKYEEAVKDFDDEPVKPVPIIKKDKKVKKKVIKYVEESSSDSDSEEEVIIKKKKKERPPPAPTPEPSIPEQITRQNLRSKLEAEQSNSFAKLMMPSYF
jgi:hypothetical protein